MKTAEEILFEKVGLSIASVRYPKIKEAMKAYAEQAIDRCAELAETKKVSNSGSWLDASIDRQSILKVKSELK